MLDLRTIGREVDLPSDPSRSDALKILITGPGNMSKLIVERQHTYEEDSEETAILEDSGPLLYR